MSDGACCHYCRKYTCVCGMTDEMRRQKIEPYEIEALLLLLKSRGLTISDVYEQVETLGRLAEAQPLSAASGSERGVGRDGR